MNPHSNGPRATFGAEGLLLLAAAIWGFAFTAQRAGMEHVGPFTFNAVRFAMGGLVLAPLLALRWKRGRPAQPPDPGKSPVLGWLLAGAVLFLGASFQQVGIVHTTAGKAGFITGLYVVVVPLLGLFARQFPGIRTWIGALLAVAGLYLLSVRGILEIGRGDLLVLACAFFFAVHVQVIGWLVKTNDPLRLACLQFLVCAAFSAVGAALSESADPEGLKAAAVPVLYAGLFSTAVAYTLQVAAQKRARPAHAAVLLSLEAVFAALGGWMILGESMGLRGLAGCILMLAGMVLAQLGARRERDPELPESADAES